MSAQASLAGLFFPTEEEKFIKEILWQPIPVHTMLHRSDHILSGGVKCPKYDATLKRYMDESKDVQQIYKKYKKHFAHWSKMCGSNITEIKHVQSLYDTLKIEQDAGKRFLFSSK